MMKILVLRTLRAGLLLSVAALPTTARAISTPGHVPSLEILAPREGHGKFLVRGKEARFIENTAFGGRLFQVETEVSIRFPYEIQLKVPSLPVHLRSDKLSPDISIRLLSDSSLSRSYSSWNQKAPVFDLFVPGSAGGVSFQSGQVSMIEQQENFRAYRLEGSVILNLPGKLRLQAFDWPVIVKQDLKTKDLHIYTESASAGRVEKS